MSVHYTATWYDIMQARQQDTHTPHTDTPVSQLQLGQRVRWLVSKWRAVCCDLQQLIVYRLLVWLSL